MFLCNPANPLPSIVVSDLKMQRVSGVELLRRLRTNERTKEIPFVMLTASNLDDDRLSARRCGASDFIVKPISFEVLIAVAANLAKVAGCGRDDRDP
jgi:two-component system, response regulator